MTTASEVALLPKDLARGWGRFQAWRERRKKGERIPRSLWALAVGLVSRYGVSRTATVLGLDFYGLRKRAEAVASPGPSPGPEFVELPAPVVLGKQCQVELSNGAGASMRVQLVGYDAADVEALTRGFWSVH
jgi:hypothetical protein